MSHNDDNLPTEKRTSLDVIEVQERQVALQEQQTKAIATLADSMKAISLFLTNGGLTQVLEGYSKIQAGNGILQGLVTHEGRKGLDARTMTQNAIESFHAMNAMHEGMKERLEDRAAHPEDYENELHNAEEAFLAWKASTKEE